MAEKIFARVDGETVHELIRSSDDISKLFHPSLAWVDVTGLTVKVGWVRTAAGFAPPPAPSPVPPAPTAAELHAELAALAARIEALKPAVAAKSATPASTP